MNVFVGYVQFMGYYFDFILVKLVQMLFGFMQVEEQFVLCFGGCNFDDMLVMQDVFVDFCFDLVNGEGDQVYIYFWVKMVYCFYQVDVIFLN